MFGRIPKKYRHKYARKKGWDEELVVFAVKVVSTAALFFLVAIGVDVASLLK